MATVFFSQCVSPSLSHLQVLQEAGPVSSHGFLPVALQHPWAFQPWPLLPPISTIMYALSVSIKLSQTRCDHSLQARAGLFCHGTFPRPPAGAVWDGRERGAAHRVPSLLSGPISSSQRSCLGTSGQQSGPSCYVSSETYL